MQPVSSLPEHRQGYTDDRPQANTSPPPRRCPGGSLGLSFRFLDRPRKGGDDFEEVTDHADIGDAENGRVGILVDGHDVSGALHADDVLDGAGDPAGDVQLRVDGDAAAADLVLVWQPPHVGDRARGADLSPEGGGELADDTEFLRRADPAAAGDDHRRLGQIDGPRLALLDSREGRAQLAGGHTGGHHANGPRGAAPEGGRGAPLDRGDLRPRVSQIDDLDELAVERLAGEQRPAVLERDVRALGGDRHAEAGRDHRGAVPSVRRVTDQDDLGRLGPDHRLENARVAVAGVIPDRLALRADDFGRAARRHAARGAGQVLADRERLDVGRAPAGLARETMGQAQQLEGGVADGAALVLDQGQDLAGHSGRLRLRQRPHQITPVFSRMRLTSSFATWSAGPESISAPFALGGGARRTVRKRADAAAIAPASSFRSDNVNVLISFFWAAMIPLRLA